MKPTTQRLHRDLVPADMCPSLVMKLMFTEGLDTPVFDDRDYPGDGYYWCLATCTQIGPDDELVEPAHCRPGRSCHEGAEG